MTQPVTRGGVANPMTKPTMPSQADIRDAVGAEIKSRNRMKELGFAQDDFDEWSAENMSGAFMQGRAAVEAERPRSYASVCCAGGRSPQQARGLGKNGSNGREAAAVMPDGNQKQTRRRQNDRHQYAQGHRHPHW